MKLNLYHKAVANISYKRNILLFFFEGTKRNILFYSRTLFLPLRLDNCNLVQGKTLYQGRKKMNIICFFVRFIYLNNFIPFDWHCHNCMWLFAALKSKCEIFQHPDKYNSNISWTKRGRELVEIKKKSSYLWKMSPNQA